MCTQRSGTCVNKGQMLSQDDVVESRGLTIGCIGAGYVGGPTMAVIAQQCPQHDVWVMDIDAAKIAAWDSAVLPVYEPGLDEVVARAKAEGNLHFTIDLASIVPRCDLLFIAVGTPTKQRGRGAGAAADMTFFEGAVEMAIAAGIKPGAVIVEKSTVPVGTASYIAGMLKRAGVQAQVISNPEFLAEGTAICDLLHPDRVLIGGLPEGLWAQELLASVYAQWVPRSRILLVSAWSSELGKLVQNHGCDW